MSEEPPIPDPDDWRTWRREGDRVFPPVPISTEKSFQVVWELTCEKYGIDPDNPPPMRKDIVRIVRCGSSGAGEPEGG